jgi:hypothetical protein
VERSDAGVSGEPDHQEAEVGCDPDYEDPPGTASQYPTTTRIVDEDRRRRVAHVREDRSTGRTSYSGG